MNQARISAGGNLTIELQPQLWRLLINGSDGTERVLVEAEDGHALRYAPTFGAQRQLPEHVLPLEAIHQVVVGWSNRDESWHLGLMLTPELAEARNSRWCEIAHWPDPETTLYADLAVQAGEALAERVQRQFSFVPAKPIETPPEPVQPPPPPLPALPLKFDQWTLNQPHPAVLSFNLAAAWTRGKFLRALWYLFWAAAFVVLSATSLTSGIALPRMGTLTFTLPNQPEFDFTIPPETLVYVGFGCAALLVLLAIRSVIRGLTVVQRIEVDGQRREVRGMRGARGVKWSIPADAFEAVYVSQIVGKLNLNKPQQGRTVHYGELLLYLKQDAFKHVISTDSFEDKMQVAFNDLANINETMNKDSIVTLTQYESQTTLQAAGLYVGQMLNLPVRYDQRVK